MSSPPLAAFELFLELPLELQRQIWLHAVQSIPPRLIDLTLLYMAHSHVPLSPLLHACRESRSAVLKRYEPWGDYISGYIAPSTNNPGIDTNSTHTSYAYVNFNSDTFILDHEIIDCITLTELRRCFYSEKVKEVRHAAVLLEDYGSMMQLAVQQIRSPSRFRENSIVFGGLKVLDTVTVVVHGESERPMGKLVEYEGGEMDGLIDNGAWPHSTAKKVMEKIKEKDNSWRVPNLRVASLIPDC
jgi:hypothetical protein